jgi:hypothetical protein
MLHVFPQFLCKEDEASRPNKSSSAYVHVQHHQLSESLRIS